MYVVEYVYMTICNSLSVYIEAIWPLLYYIIPSALIALEQVSLLKILKINRVQSNINIIDTVYYLLKCCIEIKLIAS